MRRGGTTCRPAKYVPDAIPKKPATLSFAHCGKHMEHFPLPKDCAWKAVGKQGKSVCRWLSQFAKAPNAPTIIREPSDDDKRRFDCPALIARNVNKTAQPPKGNAQQRVSTGVIYFHSSAGEAPKMFSIGDGMPGEATSFAIADDQPCRPFSCLSMFSTTIS